MSNERTLKIGIIGVGNIGNAHANTLYTEQIPRAELVALCDTDENIRNTLSYKYPNIAVFSNHKELIESGLCEAVIIATPHYFHPPIAIDAFETGLHVLTEKPAGVDCGSVKQMNEAAKRSGKVFGVMFNQRTNKLFSEARRIVSSGELGELKRVVWIITNWYRKQAYYDSGSWRATWSGEGGGVLINQAPHNLDLWQWICGMPVSVRAECCVAKFHNIEVEDDATIFAEYENGASAVFITSTGDYPGTNRLEITGTGGKLVLECGKLTVHKLAIDEREFSLMPTEAKNSMTVTEIADKRIQGHHAILANFTEAVLDGTPLIAEGYEAINELELSNAAYLSSWLGEKITLPVNDEAFSDILNKKRAESALRNTNQKEVGEDGYFDRWNTNW